MAAAYDIAISFCAPPDDLKAFFTTFYRADITCNGAIVRDALHPEWGGVRMFSGNPPRSQIAGQPILSGADIKVMGPTSISIALEVGTTSFWAFGLLPLGWATFMDVAARKWANRSGDGRAEADFAQFVPLANSLAHGADNEAEDLARIITFFRSTIARRKIDESRILAIHEMLVDPDLPTVAAMARACNLTPRTLERACNVSFGFPPKLLLSRQRFMRSLSSFMLDPTMGWIGAMDSHYYDQSHFVRDCHKFLGVSPREYATQEHPILEAFMRERMKVHGAAVSTLDNPG